MDPSRPSADPMPYGPAPGSSAEAVKDIEQLRVLSICHYVLAGLSALGGCFPVIHLAVGILMVSGAFGSGRSGPPQEMGWVFIAFAAAFIICFWIAAVLLFLAGRNLARHRRPTFCLVVACLCCLLVPLGTVLGIFTIIVLTRPSVKVLFGQPEPPRLNPDGGTE